uniref:non-specific serine/threonine protein kinase n=2 Tax=Cajanus cajan TaxID=3821 RepID=A0A151R333_CAJCA|nr:Lectin-domain containing receptor kinase A4.3 [Cajanus cajan]
MHVSNGISTPTLMLCYAMVTIVFLPPTNPLSFSYPSFTRSDGGLKLEGDAVVSRSEIQVTLSRIGQSNEYSVGRVTPLHHMLLWDISSRKLADFITKFSFTIFSEDSPYGDGLAFFLADPGLPLLNNIREGGGLGLVDGDQVLNSTQHSFVAVEFDTFKNSWDPYGPHVGINFNSMKSNITASWLTHDMSQSKVFNCSIEYNSTTLNLMVSFTGYTSDNTPVEKNISYKVDLRYHLPEWVMVGFSAATGSVYEVNILKSWSFSSSLQISDSGDDINDDNKLGKGLGIGVGLCVAFLGLACFLLWKRIKRKEDVLVEFDVKMDDEFQKGIGPKRFGYNELESATSKFAQSEKLGQGGFGGVYKGFLKDSNSYVAIKRISSESKQGVKEYATEVKIISQLRHKNLVQLLGWCHRKNDLLLIYEFMPNGSLDSHLYGGKGFLTWPIRYNIALGLASALLYLQEEWEQCVLHRDIKSSNIMLDSSFNAKLGDFGLARLVDHEKGSQTTLIAGTRGYIAPEYVITGKSYKESDIYSFGVVLLEVASGRKAIDLNAKDGQVTIVEWVWEMYELGELRKVADPKLCGEFHEEQMERLVATGLWCAHPNYRFRPSVMQVIQMLKFEAELPVLPKWMSVTNYYPITTKPVFSLISNDVL